MGGRSTQRAPAGLVVAVGLLAVPSAAWAAEHEVVATSGDDFVPADLTIARGDTVVWRNTGGVHNVKFEDGQYEEPDDASAVWASPVRRTFSSPGTFQYYCEEHGGPGGSGMAGVIRVPAQGTPDTQAPEVTGFALRRADDRVIKVVIRTSESGTATVRLSRRVEGRYRRVRTLQRQVSTGRNAFKIRRTGSGRRLRFGRYRASAEVADAAGNESERESDRLRLPPP